jgi:hypothetical protein
VEKIKVKNAQSQEEFFMIMAIVLHEQKTKRKIESKPGEAIEVSLTINGTEVSFVETARELYQRFSQNIDEIAARKVYDTVQLKGLEDLNYTIRDFDLTIRQKIADIFKISDERLDSILQ